MWVSQLVFGGLFVCFGVLLLRRVQFLRRCIMQGRSVELQTRPLQRWRNMLLVAFGQQRMFSRPWPALFHFFIYAGFLLINLEVLEIILDGLLGTHRLLLPVLGVSFYGVLIGFFESLAVLVLIACGVFLWRRNISKVWRLNRAELRGWPAWDANLILIIEVVLMVAILYMNAADTLLQQRVGSDAYPHAGPFLISQWLMSPMHVFSTQSLILIERTCWWFHILGIFAFAYYITYSKHLHIFLAFPNTYYAPLESAAISRPLSRVTDEVKAMLTDSPPPTAAAERFGTKDITDLSRKQLLEAFTCTECGRCSDVCPAHLTGKLLSPRKIMMDIRDRATEIAAQKPAANQKSLLGDYIQAEEINACTTCQACVEACPVQINPMAIILSLRQYTAMETDKSPTAWQQMFSNMENNNAPWKFPAHTRGDWQA